MHKCLSAKYYQENRERLQKKLMKDIKIFLKKNTKPLYGHKRYRNLSEDQKQKLAEYRKKTILESEKMHNYKKLF